jgi:PQQ-like domain
VARRLGALNPRDGSTLWTLELPGILTAMVLGRDGTIYASAVDGKVGRILAIDPRGTQRWQYYLEPSLAIALGGDGLLYVAAGKRIYALGSCPTDHCSDDGSTVVAINHTGSDTVRLPIPRPPPEVKKPPRPGASYAVHPNCKPSTTAVVTTTGTDFEWYVESGGSVKAADTREQFRRAALHAAGAINSHASGFGVSCVEPRGAFVIFVIPGQDVSAAAARIGDWLVREGLRGEVDLHESEVPHAL